MHSQMGQDLFKCLPSEITINIFSRLPVVTTVCCKCVCKPWLALIECPEFVKSHLSKSVPGLAVFRDHSYGLDPWPNPFIFFEFVDNIITHRCSAVFNLKLPHYDHIVSSVNGLLFLYDKKENPNDHFICNPITCDYIKLPTPDLPPKSESQRRRLQSIYGFGVSKMSGQYKVVVIFHDVHRVQTVCQVYTLGTGSWRTVEPSSPIKYAFYTEGTFVNGNLHWQICEQRSDDPDQAGWLSCFDLETELFSIFSLPPNLKGWDTVLTALEDCLVLCDALFNEEHETVFWFMDTYGDDKSWTKKFVISSDDCYGVIKGGVLCPIKVFKDGDILIVQFNSSKMFYSKAPEIYDPERGSSDIVEKYEYDRICGVSYTPSFLSLKTFTLENVISY